MTGPMDAPDSEAYRERKQGFRRLLTLYGRKPVLEALACPEAEVMRLHLARNAKGGVVREILDRAAACGTEVLRRPAAEVTRISRNGKQDQGVAADVRLSTYRILEDVLADLPERFAYVALDGVTTPANVGMAIRSVAAGGLDGILLPEKGTCDINPLVVKASAGTVFRATLVRCERLAPALGAFREAGAQILALAGGGDGDLFAHRPGARTVYVLGGESRGVTPEVRACCDGALSIPMAAGVESLNVAVAAALVAYRAHLAGDGGAT